MPDQLEERLREPPPDLPSTLPGLDLDLSSQPSGARIGGRTVPPAGPNRLPLAAIFVGIIVISLAVLAGPLSNGIGSGTRPTLQSLGGVLKPSAPVRTATPPLPTTSVASVPPSSSPPSPSAAETRVTVPLGGTHAVVVTIEDESGLLANARPMVWTPAIPIPASYGDRNIAAWTLSGLPATEVWLYWGGVICDTAETLVIGSGARSMTVTQGPWPGCDLSNDGRGLVLLFARPISAATINVTFVMSQPTQ